MKTNKLIKLYLNEKMSAYKACTVYIAQLYVFFRVFQKQNSKNKVTKLRILILRMSDGHPLTGERSVVKLLNVCRKPVVGQHLVICPSNDCRKLTRDWSSMEVRQFDHRILTGDRSSTVVQLFDYRKFSGQQNIQ